MNLNSSVVDLRRMLLTSIRKITKAPGINNLQKQINELKDKSKGLEGGISKVTDIIGKKEEKISVLSS